MITTDEVSLQNNIEMAKKSREGETVRVVLQDLAIMAEEVLTLRRIRLKVMFALADSEEELDGA